MLRLLAITWVSLLLSATVAHADRLDELLAGAGLRSDEIYRKELTESWGDWFGRIVPVPALADNDAPFGRSYALVIGVSDFDGSLDPLPATATNPTQMRQLLIEQNFDLVITLANAGATEQRIRYLMVDVFPHLMTKDDRFLFYFSGHGVVQQGSGEGFLPLTASKGLYSNMFSMRDMRTWDGSLSQVNQVLFLLDTCFSGLAGVEPQATPRELSVEQLAGYGHHLVTASTAGEQTIASRHCSGSIFTSSLIEAARGGADSAILWDADGDGTKEEIKDGVVSMYELINYARTAMAIRTAAVGWDARVTPQLIPLRSSEGEFFFVTQERMQEVASRRPDRAEVQGQAGTTVSPVGPGFATTSVRAGIDQGYTKPTDERTWGELLAKFVGQSGFAKSYALVVGISAFDDYAELPTSNDPLRVRDFLVDEAGFDYVHVLTGDKATQARINELMVDILPAMIDENDQFLFYWSGHGEQRPNALGGYVGYLPLANSREGRYSTMVSMGRLAQGEAGAVPA